MSSTMTTADNSLALLFQYTVEAYKTFQKLSETLPNPMSAAMYKNFAVNERGHRDLLEIKYLTSGKSRMPITLGSDLRFLDIVEGDLSYREMTEWMISRERSIEGKLRSSAAEVGETDRNLLIYIAGGKRAHLALLERELQMIQLYPDWYKREDAEDLVVHGKR